MDLGGWAALSWTKAATTTKSKRRARAGSESCRCLNGWRVEMVLIV